MNYSFTTNEKTRLVLNNHLALLLQRYSKLLPMRIDFRYPNETEVAINKAYIDMVYLYHMVKKQNTGIVGVSFVVENSNANNLHIHAVFYLDAQKHQKYYVFYQTIQTQWVAMTKGSTFNCQQQKYKYKALEVIVHNKEETMNPINYVFAYMSKEEQKTGINPYYQSFTSIVPLPSGRGRPRKQ